LTFRDLSSCHYIDCCKTTGSTYSNIVVNGSGFKLLRAHPKEISKTANIDTPLPATSAVIAIPLFGAIATQHVWLH